MAIQDISDLNGSASGRGSGGQGGGQAMDINSGSPQGNSGNGLIGGIISGVSDLIQGDRNASRAWKRAKEAAEIQKANQMELNKQNYDLNLQMWKDTNFSAQMEELKKAGLNPGLLYAKGGDGGTTGNAAGSAAAPNAPATQQSSTGAALMGIQASSQLALLNAQKENIEADTKNKLAQADKTAGVDTKLGESNIANVIANTANTEAKTALTKIQTSIEEVNAKIAKDTEIDQTNYIKDKAVEQLAIAQSAGIKAGVDASTYQEVISEIKANALGATLRNTLTRAQIGKTNAEKQATIEGIRQEWVKIKQGWTKLSQDEQNVKINEFKANIQAKYPGLWNIVGAAINEVWGYTNEKTGTPSYGDKVNYNDGW